MSKTECPSCGNKFIFGRMGEWWCGNSDCAVKWRDDEFEGTN